MGKATTNILWKITAKFIAPEIKCYSDKPEKDCDDATNGWIPIKAYVELLKYSLETGEFWRTMKFIAVGVSGLILNLFFIWLLDPYVGEYIAGIISTLITIITNFALNDRFTFGDKREGLSFTRRFGGYLSVGIGAKIAQIIVYEIFVFFVNPYLSMTIAVIITYIIRFLTIRDVIYNKKDES